MVELVILIIYIFFFNQLETNLNKHNGHINH